MRQRKLKNLDEKLDRYAGGIRINPKALKGRWQGLFEKEQPIYMELGCGKGQFVLALAKAYPDRNFIAVEGNRSVMLRALQKASRVVAIDGTLGTGVSGVVGGADTGAGNADGATGSCVAGVCTESSAGAAVKAAAGQAGCEATAGDVYEAAMPAAAGRRMPTLADALRGVPDAVKTVEADGLFAVGEGKASVADAQYEESLWMADASDCVYQIFPNLVFANMYLREVSDAFACDELDGLYLNFSDPWPKERHAKRRLTHRGYLAGYKEVLKAGSALEFKTDNEGLFRFSVAEFRDFGLEVLEYSEDLHGGECDYESARFMTEYEQKFSEKGNPIYYCKARF